MIINYYRLPKLSSHTVAWQVYLDNGPDKIVNISSWYEPSELTRTLNSRKLKSSRKILAI